MTDGPHPTRGPVRLGELFEQALGAIEVDGTGG